jgi:hypothetical protein
LENDSGNPKNTYSSILLPNTSSLFLRLKNSLISHGKAMLFHGHSHFSPELQKIDKDTNYCNKNGFHSFHIPSLTFPAYISETGTRK